MSQSGTGSGLWTGFSASVVWGITVVLGPTTVCSEGIVVPAAPSPRCKPAACAAASQRIRASYREKQP